MSVRKGYRDALTPDETRRWTRIGVLSALAIILGYLETFVPIPIPGVKLGLANIAVLIALDRRDLSGALGIALIKVLATGLLFGSPIMMAYSATGTLLAFAVMAPLSLIPSMHLAMVSVVGAMVHEMGQLLVAMALLGTPLVWYGAPALLMAGCVTGGICGIVAARTSQLIGQAEGRACGDELPHADPCTRDPAALPTRRHAQASARVDARAALVGFVLFGIATLRLSSPGSLVISLALATLACVAGHVRSRDVALALRPLVLILLFTLVAQVASTQGGLVLATCGPVRITQEALTTTATMMARLVSLTAASLSVMHLVGTDELVEAIDWLIGPLRLLGVRTAGFMFALKTALEFVPLLVATAQSSAEQLRGEVRLRDLVTEVFPRLVAELYAGNDIS